LSNTVSVLQLRSQPFGATLLVDVRSGSEFASGHIPGAVNIPMDQIEARLQDLGAEVPIVLVCQSGKRAGITAGLLEPCQRQISVLEGGTKAWIRAGFPVVASVKTRWSLERQVRLGAGMLVLTGEKASGEFLIQQGRIVAKDVVGVVIPKSGHWLMEEAPNKVIPKLVKFLA